MGGGVKGLEEKGKVSEAKGKRERADGQLFSLISLDILTARTHDTKRNDFPVGLTPPTSDVQIEVLNWCPEKTWLLHTIECLQFVRSF